MRYFAFFLTLALTSTAHNHQPKPRQWETHDYWALELDPARRASLKRATSALDIEVVEEIIPHHWLVRRRKDAEGDADPLLQSLRGLRRRAASPQWANVFWNGDVHQARSIVSSVRSVARQIPRQRTKRWLTEEDVARLELEERSPDERTDFIQDKLDIQDPSFPAQWHILNEKTPPHDMNITGVWEMGYTGKGVISAIVDDGLDMFSEDLAANYWARGSYDYNDHVSEPVPRLSDDLHGTRCAGEIAAVRNDVCGVGVAYDSKVSGVRILSGAISDADEAAALNYGFNETSIYSCSWGPPDDGRSMEAPSPLIVKAVLHGIENGRGGKGSIFVFASGNGANSGDQCNFDGYTNSIYSVTVGAVDNKGQHPYYSEACAANMIVAYSSGGGRNIHTTDVGKRKCTSSHGGTSAAAPLVVGVIALALEARPDLGWRDIQHLCVTTARMINPDDADWDRTAQGRMYSYKYGFGVMDAYAFVNAAKTWSLVKPQAWIEMPQIEFPNSTMTWSGEMSGGLAIPEGGIKSQMQITDKLMSENNFEKLEHITVKVWIAHHRRGDVEVSLTSPNGVKSVLGGRRKYDEDKTGYPAWTFMTLKHWDENPVGNWTIEVKDQNDPKHNGTFLGWTMSLWGSTVDSSKAKLYSQRPIPPEEGLSGEVSEDDPALASTTTSTTSTVLPTTTKQYAKPTEHLPGDHDVADGESDKATYPDHHSTPLPSTTPTPDEGYFSHESDLLSNQTWLFGGIGVVFLFAVGAGIFFWRRRVRLARLRGDYAAVADDEMAMTSMLHGGRAVDPSSRRGRRSGGTKELYDAFGEVSDGDDGEEDEDAAMRRTGTSPMVGLRYHDGFLDDDGGESPAANSPAVRYRDNPTAEEQAIERGHTDRESEASGSGEGSGSWQDAQGSSSEALHQTPP